MDGREATTVRHLQACWRFDTNTAELQLSTPTTTPVKYFTVFFFDVKLHSDTSR